MVTIYALGLHRKHHKLSTDISTVPKIGEFALITHLNLKQEYDSKIKVT